MKYIYHIVSQYFLLNPSVSLLHQIKEDRIYILAIHVIQTLYLAFDLMAITKKLLGRRDFKFGMEVNYKYLCKFGTI